MSTMKTMTCDQLGGPCGFELRGESADVVIKAQDRHLREAVRSGDTAHVQAHEDMKGRWRKPVAAMGWYRETKRTFAQLPED
jgi:predicted small metal-binding protein